MFIIETNNLNKVYKNGTKALSDINIHVKKRSITGLIGENGAGKTTLMNILVSLINKTYGNITIFNLDLNNKNILSIKKNIGFVSNEILAYEHLSVIEYWNFIGTIYKLNKNDIKNRINDLLDVLDLSKASNKLIREFSKGMKQKALIGGALIHNPKLLILDEPLDGIDPTSKIVIKNILKQFNQNGVSILLSAHDLSLINDLCTDLIIIDNGKVKFQDNIQKLHNKYKDLSLEEIFIKITNKTDKINKNLSWGENND
ncbi:ABC transporter ATP-binding protein [Clostridium sp. Marseille-Q2269]|uniref:ABC transporter ATP-binding protein n=1 Tax=Clostridium sp. Marseille-Q2269 TaxID=2942205 RepID=UPI002073D4C7|nr:ABC transporter ATP-binding protein [Clostridium sp. Marseille-Q2269]